MKEFLQVLISYLTSKEKRKVFLLVSLMLLASVVELSGVGSLFPFIKLLAEPSIVQSNHILSTIYSELHFSSIRHFTLFVGGIIFALIVLKGGMNILNNYLQARYTADINNRISKEFMHKIVHMPYENMLNFNASVLGKHFLVDIAAVTACVSAVLSIMTDVILACTLVGLMLWVNSFLVFVVVLILLGCLVLTLKITKGKLNFLSKNNEMSNRVLYKNTQEAFSGLKDVIVSNREAYFFEGVLKSKIDLSNYKVSFKMISCLPGVLINTLGFGLLLSILLVLVLLNGSLAAALPVIGVFAVSLQRLVPSATRMSTALSNIKQYRAVVFVLKDVIAALSQVGEIKSLPENKEIKFNHSLVIENLSYRYPSSNTSSLNGVSLTIEKNQSIGIVGESGAGKSTLVDVVLGLLTIEDGDILCDGKSVVVDKHSCLRHIAGYVPQQTFLLDASIKANIAFGIPTDKIDMASVDRALKVAQLDAFVYGLEGGVNTLVGDKGVKLSGGQRQRIGIARALYTDPDILIMDEATNSLDSATEQEFNKALREIMRTKTVIIIAHRLSSVSFCNCLYLMKAGKAIEQGTFEELLEGSQDFQKLYATSGLSVSSFVGDN